MDTVEVKQCVITTLTRRGNGDSLVSPIRIITEVWDAKTGDKIAESDPYLSYNGSDDNYYRSGDKNEITNEAKH